MPVYDQGKPELIHKYDRKIDDFQSTVEEQLNIRTFRQFTSFTCQEDSKNLKKEKSMNVNEKSCLQNVFSCFFQCMIGLLRSCIY